MMASPTGFTTGDAGLPEAFRREMPIAEKWAYFDHAAVSPLPHPTRQAIASWAEEATCEGDTVWPQWSWQVDDLRQVAARMIGAESAEIALVRSTSHGISLVAEGFPWQPGDNVVILADEFPTNQYPWLNLADRGVETRRVPVGDCGVDLARLAEACDGRTRVVSLSWVGYASGWRSDLDEVTDLVHRRGALVFVDAIQALGVFPLDVRRTPIDFLAADGHKWMLGPEGAGIFYLRREHLDRLRPVGVGWNSVAHAHDFGHIELVWRPTAERFEGGSQNMVGMIGFRASLELLAGFGASALSARVLEITDFACRQLEEIGAVIRSDRRPEHASGIVSFDLPGRDLAAVRQRCLERKVVLSHRGGRLRISPHGYNNEEDVARLIEALRE